MLKRGKAMAIPMETKIADFISLFHMGFVLFEAPFISFMSPPKNGKAMAYLNQTKFYQKHNEIVKK